MPEEAVDRSYRALFRVPGLGRVVTSMTLARIAQSMVGVAIVLFVLAEYHSPTLAGIVTFASIFPGLVIAPIAGALLDRHGRVRLMILDYVVALVSLALIGILALADLLPPWLLVLITVVTSLTSILSVVGLRTLYPIMAPPHLWERVNAVDSNGYVVATILGPPLAAALVVVLGAPEAMIAIAIPFGLAAGAIFGLKEPRTANASTGRLFYDAWQGVRYAWAQPDDPRAGLLALGGQPGLGDDDDPHPDRHPRRPPPGGRDGGPRLRRLGRLGDGLGHLLRPVRHPWPGVADVRHPDAAHGPDGPASCCPRPVPSGRSNR